MTDAAKSSLIPVTLLTGFLGSGKTTLLNHLVQQPELANALVIINEFGEIALDHALVAHSSENVLMEMSNGCLCCNIRGDLVKTLHDISWRFSRNGQRQFERVLIETTGLADPAPIIHTLMTHPKIGPKYKLDGIVTCVDLATGMHTLDEHIEAVKQAAMADTLVLTKGDLISEQEKSALLHRLAEINPAAPRQEVFNGKVSPQSLLNLGLFNSQSKIPDVARWLKEEVYQPAASGHHHDHTHASHDHAHHHAHSHETHDHAHHHHDVNRHDDHIRAFCFTVEKPIPNDMLAAWLETLMSCVGKDILRVKGILNVEGNAQPFVVHGVQHIFHPPVPLPAWPYEDRRSRLVFITHNVERDVIERTFQAFHQVIPQPEESAA